MSHTNICKGFGIEVLKKDKKYVLGGLSYNGSIVIYDWEILAFFLVIVNDYIKKQLEKNIIYKIGNLELSRTQKDKRQYLKVQTSIAESAVYLNETEVKFFPAVCNRVIARCDILMKDKEYDGEYVSNYKVGFDNYWIGNKEGEI